MGKMELQRFRLLCIFLFVTILVVQGPSTTYADEPELEPCPSIIPRPAISPIPIPPIASNPITPSTPPSSSIPPAPTPSEDDD